MGVEEQNRQACGESENGGGGGKNAACVSAPWHARVYRHARRLDLHRAYNDQIRFAAPIRPNALRRPLPLHLSQPPPAECTTKKSNVVVLLRCFM